MSGFTPGPWIASDYYSDATTIIDGSGFSIADAPRCLIHEGWPDKGFEHWADSPEAHRWISEEEQRANARLIAAAPELLEALQEMVSRIEYYANLDDSQKPSIEDWESTYNSSDMDAARAALAKALGQ